jgi:hypothetical protein
MRVKTKTKQPLLLSLDQRSRIGIFTAAVSLLLQSCSQSEHRVSVTAAAPTTTPKYLDDIEWKQRTEFGRAFSNWAFLSNTHFNLNKIDEKREGGRHIFQFEITGANIKLGLECTETLPIGVKDPLRKHEDMHCQMTTECYQAAPDTAKKIAQEMVGQKITISEVDDQRSAEKLAQLECKRRFSLEYRVTTQTKADRLADIFDRITNHGLNGVSNEDGRQRSFDEYNRDYKPLESANNPPQPPGSFAPVPLPSTQPGTGKPKPVAKTTPKGKETVKAVEDPEEAKRLQSMGAWKTAPPTAPAANQQTDRSKTETSDGPIVSPATN